MGSQPCKKPLIGMLQQNYQITSNFDLTIAKPETYQQQKAHQLSLIIDMEVGGAS